jgi:CRP-like cAMP-binding protein
LHAGTFKNSVLKALDLEIIERLSLRPVTFELGHEIEFPGNKVDHIFFVEDGMASMTAAFSDGSQVEVGMFGFESIIGISALMGTKRSLNRIYTQIPGRGYSSRIEHARTEFLLAGSFHSLALRYVQAQLLQTAQSAACNVKHSLEQRLVRWLLLCADRAHSDTLRLSHEFLADMLGASRPTVSLAAAHLKDEGLIDYSRGLIRLRDIKGMERTSCECYRVIKDYLDNYTEFDSGIVA